MPFTVEQFLNVMENYNLTVWPMQVIFNILALVMIFFLFTKAKIGNHFINLGLSFLWVWIGIVYHLVYFTSINPAAYLFGIFNIIQGLLFFYFGFIKQGLKFTIKKDWPGILGGIFILYALIIYPVLGASFGHVFPRNPTFGLPCPTTIFTFGILLFALKKVPWYLIIIPLIWSLIGSAAAVKLTIYEDYGLGIAGVAGFIVILLTNKKREGVDRKR